MQHTAIRLSYEDREILKRDSKKYGMNHSEYLRYLLRVGSMLYRPSLSPVPDSNSNLSLRERKRILIKELGNVLEEERVLTKEVKNKGTANKDAGKTLSELRLMLGKAQDAEDKFD
ncbi:hypothetical protein M0R04_09385 [Candidatus Dojkabacteria bacterium]|jgi:hypothetical protein|nr:hypothetical protein [Candidatus Dojkabacteria bacterium]